MTVPPGESNVLFSHVVDALEFPMPKAAEIDSYVVYIGFDPIAAQEMDRRQVAPAGQAAAPPIEPGEPSRRSKLGLGRRQMRI